MLAYGAQDVLIGADSFFFKVQSTPVGHALFRAIVSLNNLTHSWWRVAAKFTIWADYLEQDKSDDPMALCDRVAEALLSGAESPIPSAPRRTLIVLRQWGLKLRVAPEPWWVEDRGRAAAVERAVWARCGARLLDMQRAAQRRACALLFAKLVLSLRRRLGRRFLERRVFGAPSPAPTSGGGQLLLELLRAPRLFPGDCSSRRAVDDAARGVHEMLGILPEQDGASCRALLVALRRQRAAERAAISALLEVYGAAAAAVDALSARELRRRERRWTEHVHEHWLLPPPTVA